MGLALLAVMALGAVSATGASATPAQFHSEIAHTELRAEQHAGEDTFTVNAGTARCNRVAYTGTQATATATTVSVTPQYSECKAFGFINTTVDHNGCTYLVHAVSTTGASPEGSVDILCPAGKAIVVTAFNCYVSVGSQNGLKTVTCINVGSGKTRDVTVDVSLAGIKYTQESKSFPGCTNGTFTNGTYVGAATAIGTDTLGNQVGVWYH